MKHLSFLWVMLLLGAPLYATTWGALDDYDTGSADEPATSASAKPTQAVPSASFKAGSQYLLQNIIKGQPIKVYVMENDFTSYKRHETEDLADGSATQANTPKRFFAPPSDEFLEKLPVYQDLISHAAQVISKANRKKEFADILPLLERSVSIQFVQEQQQADITFYITDLNMIHQRCNNEYGLGCYYRDIHGKHIIWLPVNSTIKPNRFERIKIKTLAVGIHEVGHSLGLSDQYDEAADQNSHPVYASTHKESGIMNNDTNKMTCDDADGLINLIDITRHVPSERNEYGWRSLCRSSKDVYSYGKPATRGPYMWHSGNLNEGIELVTYENNATASRFVSWNKHQDMHVLRPLTSTPLKYDGAHRVVHARGEHGEDIYYTYRYLERTKIVVANNQLLYMEKSFPSYKQYKNNWLEEIDHSILFWKNKNLIEVNAQFNKKSGGMISYIERKYFADNYPSYVLYLRLDKHKKIIDRIDNMVPVSHSTTQPLPPNKVSGSSLNKKIHSVSAELNKQDQQHQQQQLDQELTGWFQRHYR